jgi:hypothetical protein
MVRVDTAVPVPGTKFAGEKLQLNPLGRPAHESAIELLKAPDCGLAVTCMVPDLPAGMLILAGAAVKDKAGVPPPEPVQAAW